jgi:hypothetical protein
VRLAAIWMFGLTVLTLLTRPCAAADQEATHVTPPPQPPLVMVTGAQCDDLRAAFNSAADRPRLLAIFSPT